MDTANRLGWWWQLREKVVERFPAPRRPRVVTETFELEDDLTPEEARQLAEMVDSLGRLFPFARPSEAFRASLKQALMAEHRRRLTHRKAVPARRETGISWRWSLAATAPLLIGVLATILWRRSHRSNGQLISPVGGR